MNRRLTFMLAGALIVGLVVGLAVVFFEVQARNRGLSSPISVSTNFSYAALTREEMIDQADLIFVGQVVHITPTRWNQDSGEYWDEEETPDLDSALLYHEIELTVIRPVVDTLGVGEKVILTVLGNSPVGPQPEVPGLRINSRPVIIEDSDSPVHDLKVGDQAVVFAERREIAWRGGMRPALMLMGYPQDSYLVQGEDGLYHFWRPELEPPVSLETLIAQIAERRETLAQP